MENKEKKFVKDLKVPYGWLCYPKKKMGIRAEKSVIRTILIMSYLYDEKSSAFILNANGYADEKGKMWTEKKIKEIKEEYRLSEKKEKQLKNVEERRKEWIEKHRGESFE